MRTSLNIDYLKARGFKPDLTAPVRYMDYMWESGDKTVSIHCRFDTDGGSLGFYMHKSERILNDLCCKIVTNVHRTVEDFETALQLMDIELK